MREEEKSFLRTVKLTLEKKKRKKYPRKVWKKETIRLVEKQIYVVKFYRKQGRFDTYLFFLLLKDNPKSRSVELASFLFIPSSLLLHHMRGEFFIVSEKLYRWYFILQQGKLYPSRNVTHWIDFSTNYLFPNFQQYSCSNEEKEKERSESSFSLSPFHRSFSLAVFSHVGHRDFAEFLTIAQINVKVLSIYLFYIF